MVWGRFLFEIQIFFLLYSANQIILLEDVEDGPGMASDWISHRAFLIGLL